MVSSFHLNQYGVLPSLHPKKIILHRVMHYAHCENVQLLLLLDNQIPSFVLPEGSHRGIPTSHSTIVNQSLFYEG